MTIAGAGLRGDVLGRGVAVGMRKNDAELKTMFDQAIKAAHHRRHDPEAHGEVVQDRHGAASLSGGVPQASSPAGAAPAVQPRRAQRRG